MPSIHDLNVTGDPSCAGLFVYWYSWEFAPDIAEMRISETTGLFNCGNIIAISEDTLWPDHGIINMYGGTVYTPLASSGYGGLKIGNESQSYGLLNIYSGLMTIPRIEIEHGTANLYGGVLENTSGISAALIISESYAMNKINIAGGSLRLIGDHRAEIDANIEAGRIIPCYGRGLLVIDYNVLNPGYTTVSATSNLKMAWNPKPPDYQKKISFNHPTLTWSPGDYVQNVNEHRIYFGTSFIDVNDANTGNPRGVYKGVSDVNNYTPPDLLDINATYYWRIDEVNNTNSNSPWKGKVWRFTTTLCPVGGSGLVGDFTEDCIVDLYDMKVMNQEWLTAGPAADIFPEIPDGIVDFSDFAILAKNWLVEEY
jgi:hypothetical protein